MTVNILEKGSQLSKQRDSFIKPLNTICITGAHASVGKSKHKVELDSPACICVVGDNCLVIHDDNRPVNVYSYDPRDGHRSAKTVVTTVGYCDPQSRQKYILMINQAIVIDNLESHLLYPMQCSLNGINVNEVNKFLAESSSMITHLIQLTDLFNEAHPLMIPCQLSSLTGYLTI